MIVIECHYTDPPHEHEYPDDWQFGGADGLHPGADPRYKPTTYRYYNDRLEQICITQQFLCDDEAIDMFTWVRDRFGKPVYVEAKRPDGSKVMLTWVYDPATDEVSHV